MTGGAQDSGALHRLVGELADALQDASNNGFGEEFFRIHVKELIERARATPAPAGWQPEKDDAFTHGYLVAVSSLIGGYGATDYAEYLLQEIGDVSDEDLKRIDLCEYDLENLRPIIASLRSTAPAEGGV